MGQLGWLTQKHIVPSQSQTFGCNPPHQIYANCCDCYLYIVIYGISVRSSVHWWTRSAQATTNSHLLIGHHHGGVSEDAFLEVYCPRSHVFSYRQCLVRRGESTSWNGPGSARYNIYSRPKLQSFNTYSSFDHSMGSFNHSMGGLNHLMGSKTDPMMLDDGPVFYLAISALAIFTVLGCCQKYRLSHSQPQLTLPGPKPLPVLGNMLSLDTARPWLTFSDWRSTYGWYFVVGVYS